MEATLLNCYSWQGSRSSELRVCDYLGGLHGISTILIVYSALYWYIQNLLGLPLKQTLAEPL